MPTSTDDQKSESVPKYCIDAGSVGNVARFINHSCEPNLFVQCVLSSHHDAELARVMLFAADNIPPLQVIHYFLSDLTTNLLEKVISEEREWSTINSVYAVHTMHVHIHVQLVIFVRRKCSFPLLALS